MKIYGSQINPTVGSCLENAESIVKHLDTLKPDDEDIVVFSELAITGYPPRDLLSDPLVIFAEKKALETLISYSVDKSFAFIVGHTTPSKETFNPLHNSASLIYKGKIVFQFHKRHIPNYDIFSEERFFAAAPKTQDNTFKWQNKTIEFAICEDSWEQVNTYNTTQSHAYLNNPNPTAIDYYINLSASPYCVQKNAKRHATFQKIALQKKCPVLFVNQWGVNDDIVFDGNSFIVGENGNIQYQSPSFEEATFCFDPSDKACSKNKTTFCEWRTLHSALVMGIKDYFHKSSFNKCYIGLSGGVDSALITTLSVSALGKDNVSCVRLNSKFTSQQSKDDAALLAQRLGVELLTYDIQPAVDACQNQLQLNTENLSYENLQSRTRSMFLMGLSNQNNALLLATSNKSELAMGYSTLYGDLCGALLPIGDLFKSDVYGLCHYINSIEATIQESILNRSPTAELKADQKDSDSLPNYEILDAFLIGLIEKGTVIPERLEKWDHFLKRGNTNCHSLLKKFHMNEYKRYQSPPIIKVRSRSFGSGWRMPLAKKV